MLVLLLIVLTICVLMTTISKTYVGNSKLRLYNTLSGIQLEFGNTPSAVQCFEKLWDEETMNVITLTNQYAVNLQNVKRPHRRYARTHAN